MPTGLSLSRDSPKMARDRADGEIIAASIRTADAFSEVFERHWTAIYRFCQGRAGAAGEDIAAETFRVAFDRRNRYEARYDDARPWLFGIATNLLRDHFRGVRREENKNARAAAWDALSWEQDDPGGLERQLLGPQLAAALKDLPATDRDALLLLAWADLDYAQIAQALDIPVGTVRSRIHRARQRLRDHLNEHRDNRPPRTERGSG